MRVTGKRHRKAGGKKEGGRSQIVPGRGGCIGNQGGRVSSKGLVAREGNCRGADEHLTAGEVPHGGRVGIGDR
eukprot:765983-Hanusia_phi.AAC.8